MNLFLGARDAVLRFRLFGLLTLVFFFAAAISLIPLHFLSTMRSPEFISYMGIGRSDIRIDLRQAGESSEDFARVVSRIAADTDIEQFSVLTTSTFTLLRESGEEESFAVQTGDFTVFPLDYLRGEAPRAEDEIALSHLNSNELDKKLGDTLSLSANGVRRELRVVGIYQDITDGGRTAKATFPPNENSVLARTVNLDLAPGVSKDTKAAEYRAAFGDARVTDLEGYLSQTLGTTLSQLSTVTAGAIALGLVVSVLITSLFFRMLIAKDTRRIAIMRSIGFSQRAVRLQYLASSLLLLVLGIGVGTLFSNTLGQQIVSFLWSFMGAARIEFVIDPVKAYLLIPAALMAAVAVTTLSAVRRIKDRSISAAITQ
jgi:putative ABC transport system permease protein